MNNENRRKVYKCKYNNLFWNGDGESIFIPIYLWYYEKDILWNLYLLFKYN